MRCVASALVGGDVPLYHAPSGTENLFAKSMHMTASPDDVVSAMFTGEVSRIDTATANGAFLLLMASMGYDAAVVADLARHRSGSITHWSYAFPMLRQLFGFKSPRLTIDVDEERIVDQRRGWVVVANSSAYAKGLNPARHASVTDELLDVVFLPVKKRSDIIWWMGKLLRGTHLDYSGVISRRGAEIVITSDDPAVWQLDGDPSPDVDGTKRLDVRVDPASLPIITTTCHCQ
jgi:diacylglycerol kinase (ATP)